MADWCFPFKTPPQQWWNQGRAFGAYRTKTRKHGGCDIIKPAYEQIYAVADGVLVHEEKEFYLGTFYVTYQHGPYLIRYGETQGGSSTKKKAGDTIKKGEPLAKVGLMYKNAKKKIRYDASGPRGHMLHFEMYSKGSDHSGLWSDYGPYNRRKDVIDPGPFLDEWVKNLP
ncbi:MAG: M23 family metallopeptidase [Polyangiaceae bacterium]|nr:M23 family metallopeptidase [Polyangiaceae bacterium]